MSEAHVGRAKRPDKPMRKVETRVIGYVFINKMGPSKGLALLKHVSPGFL